MNAKELGELHALLSELVARKRPALDPDRNSRTAELLDMLGAEVQWLTDKDVTLWDRAERYRTDKPTMLATQFFDQRAATTSDKARVDGPAPDGGSADYYKLPVGAVELDDVLVGMSWHQANIVKAAYRWDSKPGVALSYNLTKIIWFAQRAQRAIGGDA